MQIRTQTFCSEISRPSDAKNALGRSQGLQVFIRKYADVTILDLHGSATFTGGHSTSLNSYLQELVANGVRKLLLNLTSLTQVDSSGVGTIVGAFVSVRRKGGDLRLLRPGGRVLEVLARLRLLEIIPNGEHESRLLASFRPMGCFTEP